MHTPSMKIALSLADDRDRESIYAIRHQVYAQELKQHPENGRGRLTDKLDAINTYLVAKRCGEIAGFIAMTPPGEMGYSLDKYFAREGLPLVFDRGLYEVRLLTVSCPNRGSDMSDLRLHMREFEGTLSRLERVVEWQLDSVPFR